LVAPAIKVSRAPRLQLRQIFIHNAADFQNGGRIPSYTRHHQCCRDLHRWLRPSF
jgi:Ni/Co efflux regulator RcnB